VASSLEVVSKEAVDSSRFVRYMVNKHVLNSQRQMVGTFYKQRGDNGKDMADASSP